MLKVLLSNLPLPFGKIGSWTFEFDYFLTQNQTFFDFVISPNTDKAKGYLHAKKGRWFKGTKYFRDFVLRNWVVKDFISSIRSVARHGKPLQILVVDDLTIVEGISHIKSELPSGSELIFYYHGHALELSSLLQQRIDRVFFLTDSGYQESLKINTSFIPEVAILGNGVSSDLFFPLNPSQKDAQRMRLGFKPGQKIVCWLANSRPVKGIHLFGKMIPELLALDPEIRIVTIGHDPIPSWNHQKVLQLGRMTSSELAKYLQVSDFYFFTSLWKEGFGLSLVEAIKCGNYVLCSENGGIPSVVHGCPRVSLIKSPNIISAWVEEFSRVSTMLDYHPSEDLHQYLKSFYSLENWEKKLKKALN